MIMTKTIILLASALIDLGQTYFKGPTAVNYQNASAYCQSQRTTLASIVTESEWEDAKSVCSADRCWIGLRDDLNGNDDMIWAWDDHSDIANSYGFNADKTATTGQVPWDRKEPNEHKGKQQDFVMMYANTGKYHDEEAHFEFHPLCNDAPPLSYFRGSRPGSYADAAAQCASEGTTLASIGTESDWNDARTVCGAMDCWIGSRDDRHGNDEMIFSWDDGTDITTSYGFNANKTATTGQGPWYAGQPDESHGTEEDCVAMYHTYETGKYVDAQCISHYYPLCNKAPIQREYFRGPALLSYGAASTYCRSHGSTLASISTVDDWNEANSVCGQNNCWIGLRHNFNDDMTWRWDDSTRITNSYGFNPDGSATTGQGPWYAGQPNQHGGFEEDCVVMYHEYETGKYTDTQCSGTYYPLCNKARRKYFKGVSRVTYQAAQTYCQAEGGSLATIVTELDWVAAKSVCESSKCWLGLQGDLIINDKMIWSWPDGSAIEKSYGFNPDKTATKGQEPWDTRQPSQLTGSSQACVIMYDYGLYHNMECDRLFIPLCTVNNGAHSQRRLMDILFDVEDQNRLNIIEINEDILHQ